jgi:hypothetical protein
MFQPIKKVAVAVLAIAALALGGAAIAGAASSSTATTATTTSPPSTPGAQAPPFGGAPHGSAAHEGAEKAVTGEAATKAQAAAVKYVGSGSAGPVTTDCMGSGYETTVTKPDGSKVEVHLDSSFAVAQGPRGPGGPPPGATG